MENCIFCKIINNQIPSAKIYENEKYLAFLDINPVSKGHSLIIPKNHIEWMHEEKDADLAEIFILTKKLMLNIKEKLPCDFVQVGVVGKDVPHFHVHLIPRYFNDTLPNAPTVNYEEKELNEFREKITLML